MLLVVTQLQQCGPKEKVEEISSSSDSVLVEQKVKDTVTTAIESTEEMIPTKEVEVVKKEEVNTTLPKTTETLKSITKQVVKTAPETKVKTEIEEIVKKEVTPEKVVEKKVEVKNEVVVVKEEVKTIVNTSDWIVPEKYKNLKNPVEASKDNLNEAKSIYDIQCKSCHGSRGLGDGTKAKSMKGDLGDFSSAKFQAQTDGELFYKTKIGRADMPSYAKKLSDDDIWYAVLYMRSLKK
jgi:mono/diheme cytochrome c family protein